MEFREVIEERRSIRRFFPKPIPLELIGELISHASKAPSIGDLQPWNFIICTKAKQIQDVADSCPYERWLYQAPLVIVVCALEGKAESYYPGKGAEWAQQSCAAAAENILLGAVDVGLGGCWVTSFEMIKVKEVLHIPDGIEPRLLLAIGYPDEEPKSKRYAPFNTNTFFNDFGASNMDVAIFKKDYGLFFRNKIDDVKTRAAYATSERGSLRTGTQSLKQRIKSLFSKKKTNEVEKYEQEQATPKNGNGHAHEMHERENPEDHEVDHDHDGHDWHAH